MTSPKQTNQRKSKTNRTTPNHLRFGIPSLDALFGGGQPIGIRLPEKNENATDASNASVSICISGPDGTGKSLIGLHLAAHYLADCSDAANTRVLYVSTDLKYRMALKVWTNFNLDWPHLRKVPFGDNKAQGDVGEIKLTQCAPLKDARGGGERVSLSEGLTGEESGVFFVDLASATVGDDWGYVNRVLSALEDPGVGQPCHLMVIDSVEGFETLVGERDAFGLTRERRSRIAQVMRSASDKCHTLFIVEEPKEGERLPEEFVTDVVIRLRSEPKQNYVRRTIEIEKARGHSHVRGQHSYLIRSGAGSTTGQGQNPDDPLVENIPGPVPAGNPKGIQKRARFQSYLHVCHSLHHSYRQVMTRIGKGRPAEPQNRFAGFGIRYLDDMIETGTEDFKRENGDDRRGARCGSTTALIGNPDTQKGPLGVAFLSRCFREYAEAFSRILDELDKLGEEKRNGESIETLKFGEGLLREGRFERLTPFFKRAQGKLNEAQRAEFLRTTFPLSDEQVEDLREWAKIERSLARGEIESNKNERTLEVLTELGVAVENQKDYQPREDELEEIRTLLDRKRRDLFSGITERPDAVAETWSADTFSRHLKAFWRISNARIEASPGDGEDAQKYLEDDEDLEWQKASEIHPLVKTAAWILGPPNLEYDGIPLLLTTQDVHAQQLVRDFLPWIMRKVPNLKKYKRGGAIAALRILMEQYTVCRRLEIHDLPSAVLIHILQTSLDEARLLCGVSGVPGHQAQSQGIRVVIDDCSILKDTYIEIREEPLLLRFIVFYLAQQGVTTLLIDTQPGRPDTTIANPLHSELRSLVDNRISTWRFPFYGEDRVAIAVNPPAAPGTPGVIRELRRGIPGAPGPEAMPLVVDPDFELYTGLQKGEAKPIALEVWLYEETPAFKAYIKEENQLYAELFTPFSRTEKSDDGGVIAGVPRIDYDKLREICYLQRHTRLDHTRVFQVDEFWMMPTSLGLRRAGAFRPQWKYLNAITAEKRPEGWEREWAEDAFRVFQKAESDTDTDPDKHRRRYVFDYHGLKSELDEGLNPALRDESDKEKKENQELKESVDRVPFMWDFGFLLCKVRAWEGAGDQTNSGGEPGLELEILKANEARLFRKEKGIADERKLTKRQNDKIAARWKKERFRTTKQVWEAMPKATKNRVIVNGPRPTWRVFLEACYHLAQSQAYSRLKPVRAFDISGSSFQTLSSLILEIWASEIYQRKLLQPPDPQREAAKKNLPDWLKQLEHRRWRQVSQESLHDWLADDDDRRDLFKVWMLLVEVLDFEALAKTVKEGSLRIEDPNPTSIAVRHWYKTACQATESLSFDDPLVPVGLPGHFSVRGDWFLAVAGGSRSGRLADRALDLLSSVRANHSRMQLGLGLPTRKLSYPNSAEPDELRTSILTLDAGSGNAQEKRARRISRVSYESLTKIGSDPNAGFHWFWRSGLRNYYRHTRIWQNWVTQMILWWDRMRYLEHDIWMNGFERYDKIEADPTSLKGLEAWTKFNERCDRLLTELRQATPKDGASSNR